MLSGMADAPPLVLTIAGSDCSAGAGLQADLKTFSTLGVHGLTAVTCVVAETPLTVQDIQTVEPATLQQQLRLLLDTYPVSAVKTGLLGSVLHVVAVSELLAGRSIPIVVDPVMVASTGDPLLDSEAVTAYRHRLLPLAALVTPNLMEARQLLELRAKDAGIPPREAAEALAERFGCSALVTGGDDAHSAEAVDWLRHDGQTTPCAAPRVGIRNAHGTGCTLSAAIAARLAAGRSLPEAVTDAKRFLSRTLDTSYAWTSPSGEEIRAINQLPHPPFAFD